MRSALEGVAFSLRQGLNTLRETGVNPTSLRLAGGGTIEPAWQQLLADVLQLPLHPLSETAASARGAAILAGVGIELYSMTAIPKGAIVSQTIQPNPPHPALEAAWQRYESLYPSLQDWKLESGR